MRRTFIRLLVVFLSVACTNLAAAMILTFSPGIAYEKNGDDQTLLLQTSPQSLSNRYLANTNTRTAFSPQLFLGGHFYQHSQTDLQLGVTLGAVDSLRMSGIVDQFALPEFDNFDYQYNIRSFTVMPTMKLFVFANKALQPYISASAGYAHNYSYSYQEEPRIFGAVPMSPFQSNNTNSFAYAVGAGLMYNFNKTFSIGIGYQYADLGRAKLGTSRSQQTTQTLTLDHIRLNQLLFNFSWNIE